MGGVVRSVPALLDLGAGRRRRCPAPNLDSSNAISRCFAYFPLRIAYKGWDVLPDPDVPPSAPCKKRSIQHRMPRRCRCGWVTLRRLTSFWAPVRREVPLFVLTEFACRLKSPVEGVLGINMVCPARMQPSWLAEYSQKCTVLPRGPVRAAKTIPAFLSASPFCCADFSECRARIS